MSYDVEAINKEMWEWRAALWPQISMSQVGDQCIPRFQGLGTCDRWVSTCGHGYAPTPGFLARDHQADTTTTTTETEE